MSNSRSKNGDLAEAARELIYQAWEKEDLIERVALAQQAIEVYPRCADAYLILAESNDNLIDRADLCRQAMDLAAFDLGKTYFKENRDIFWLAIETRPYMRARFALAESLVDIGLLREAAHHYLRLLELNAHDNQGARHRLAEILLELGELRDLADLLDRFSDESFPVFFQYTRALLAFRLGEREQANRELDTALVQNPYIPDFLWGDRTLPDPLPTHYELGSLEEAAVYVAGTQGAWLNTPGALRWLGETQGDIRIKAPIKTKHKAYEDVENLLRQYLSENHDSVFTQRAIDLWKEYALATRPIIRKASVYAAAFEYVLSDLAELTNYSQSSIAKRYGVSISALSRVSRAINEWISQMAEEPDPLGFLPTQIEEDQSLSTFFLDDDMIDTLINLPRSEEVWIGFSQRLSSRVQFPHPHYPTLICWYRYADKEILSKELLGTKVEQHALFIDLLKAFSEPISGNPRLPSEIWLEDPLLVEEFEDVLAPLGIRIALSETHDQEFANQIGAKEISLKEDRYCCPGVEQKLIRTFFSSVAEYCRSSAWEIISEDTLFEIRVDIQGLDKVYFSVLGKSSLDRGLVIFYSEEDYFRFFRQSTFSELEGAFVGAPVELLRLTFEHGADLDQSLRREIFKHGWEVVGPEDYPILNKYDSGAERLELSALDYQLVSIIGETISLFHRDYGDQLKANGKSQYKKLYQLNKNTDQKVQLIFPVKES